jgi:hypothetical protein
MAYSRNSVDWDHLMETFENGMIFVVDATTFTDVIQNELFGLPASYLKEMKLLNPGKSALFFFERNAHTISGIFTSTEPAEANINTKIWRRNFKIHPSKGVIIFGICFRVLIPRQKFGVTKFLSLEFFLELR